MNQEITVPSVKRFYSARTRGFYSTDLHDSVPDDAVEVSHEEWMALMEAQSLGKQIGPNEQGRPTATTPVPTPEQSATARRAARDSLLAETDWLVNRHRDEVEAGGTTTLSSQTYKDLQTWRGALRGVTAHADFPNVQIPSRPPGV